MDRCLTGTSRQASAIVGYSLAIDLPHIPANKGTESRSERTKIQNAVNAWKCLSKRRYGAIFHTLWIGMRERSFFYQRTWNLKIISFLLRVDELVCLSLSFQISVLELRRWSKNWSNAYFKFLYFVFVIVRTMHVSMLGSRPPRWVPNLPYETHKHETLSRSKKEM